MYSRDAIEGIYVPGNPKSDVAKDAGASAVSGANTNISGGLDIGTQLVQVRQTVLSARQNPLQEEYPENQSNNKNQLSNPINGGQKTMIKYLLFIIMQIPFLAHAQMIEELSATPLEIGYEKTLHIIFPTEVKYCNAGNDHILAEKVSAQPNIIRIIAAERNFPGETNLSIVTADTKFYSYSIHYSETPKVSYIHIGDTSPTPHVLPVGKDKQMYLIFPGKITYEDHGSQDITVEKAEGVDNILAVKAVCEFQKESNISVVTDNGKFYTFNLQYSPNPEVFTFVIDKDEQQKVAILDEGELTTDRKKKSMMR